MGIRFGYKGTLYEVVDSYDGKFGIMRTDIDERNVLWAEASQLIKVLDKEEFGEKISRRIIEKTVDSFKNVCYYIHRRKK